MATPPDNSLFQDMVLELQLANSTLPKIEANTYESGLTLIEMSDKLAAGVVGGGKTSGSGSSLSEIAANTDKTSWAVMNLTDVMSYNLGNLVEVLTGNKLQEEENRREMLEVFKKMGGGGDRDKGKPKVGKGAGGLGNLGLLGMIAGLVAGIGSLVVGFFAGIAESVKKILLSTKIGAQITGYISAGIGKVMAFFGSITKAITESKTFKFIGGNISKAIKGITEFFKPVGEVFKLFSSGGKGLFALSSVKNIVKVIEKVAGPLFRLGTMFGKLFVPLTVIMSVYDSIMGGIEAYEKGGGIGEILQGGITGLLTSLIGAPLDLLKSAVSWIIGKLGFEEAEGFLDSFSFSDLIGGVIKRIVAWGQYLFELIFQPLSDAFQDISDGIANGDILKTLAGFGKQIFAAPLDILKNLLGGLAGLFSDKLKKKIDSFSFGEIFGGVKSDVPKMPEMPPLWSEVTAKKVEKKAREQAKEIGKEQEESLDPFGKFYKGLMEAYNETTQKRITGAEISATQASTADMQAEASSAPVVVANPPSSPSPNISTSSQNVTYNATAVPDRTNLLLQPSYAGF
jgi:hypothetical protein